MECGRLIKTRAHRDGGSIIPHHLGSCRAIGNLYPVESLRRGLEGNEVLLFICGDGRGVRGNCLLTLHTQERNLDVAPVAIDLSTGNAEIDCRR